MKLKIFIFSLILFACKATTDPRPQIEQDLKATMQSYLYNAINNDSSNAKYRVEDVIYFDDKDKYICNFTVNLKAKLFDTTGEMRATVSKDFRIVKRIY